MTLGGNDFDSPTSFLMTGIQERILGASLIRHIYPKLFAVRNYSLQPIRYWLRYRPWRRV